MDTFLGVTLGGTVLAIVLGMVPLVGVGALLAFVGLRSRRKAAASQSWPVTNGKVVATNVHASTSTDSDGFTSTSYSPQVSYEYNVAGQTYQSSRMSFGGVRSYGSPMRAQQELANFPVGGALEVYYNPEKPSEAVLTRTAVGGGLMLWLGVGLASLGCIIGCVTVVFAAGLGAGLSGLLSSFGF